MPSAEQASMHPDHRVCFHYQTAVCETEQHRRKKKPSEGVGSCQDIQEAIRAELRVLRAAGRTQGHMSQGPFSPREPG